MTSEQQSFVNDKIAYCAKNIAVLKPEEVQKICVEFDFDELKIEEYLRFYEIEDKYKGIAAFEWQET